MGPFFRKDVLVYWRDRKEILMALITPVLIIVVLNFAFSGLFDSDSSSVNINVGIVMEDDEALGLEEFEETLDGLDLSITEKEVLIEQAKQISPVLLLHELFNNPELKEWITTKELKEAEAIELVEAGDLDAILKVPEGFTYEVLSQVMLGEQSDNSLLIQAEEQSTEVDVLQEIVQNFITTMNFEFALGNTVGRGMTEPQLPVGGMERIENVESYTMTQYFTIAIGTLFALFISQTVALKTVTEKRERVFNRILLTNSNPLHFLMGKTISAFCLTWLQMMITFTITQFMLNVFPGTFDFWLGLIAVISTFALTVAGLCAVFTVFSLNMDDSNAVSGLTTLVVMTFAVLGGSFFPIQAFPEFIQKIGEWTPNGLTQTTLIGWIQYSNMEDLVIPGIIHIVFFVVCMIIGMATFPRRGRV